MTTDSMRPSGVAPARVVVAHSAATRDTVLESWVDLLVADDEWVRQEFEDIVAAGWGSGVPPSPPTIQRSERPRRRGYDHRPTPGLRPEQTHVGASARPCQRGPPG